MWQPDPPRRNGKIRRTRARFRQAQNGLQTMKNRHYVLAAIVIAIAAALLGAALARSAAPAPAAAAAKAEVAPAPTEPLLSHQQETWIATLNWCESRGKDTAINPKDSDGTPSYGRFQFKPGTYYGYIAQYHLATSTNVMDADTQQDILEHMVLDKSITAYQWRHQLFPDCVRLYGTPPLST